MHTLAPPRRYRAQIFKDPSGFTFYRQLHKLYRNVYGNDEENKELENITWI